MHDKYISVSRQVLILHIMLQEKFVVMPELCTFPLHTHTHACTNTYTCMCFLNNSFHQSWKSKKKQPCPLWLLWSIWGWPLSAFFCKWLLCLRREINWFPRSATFLEKNLSREENRESKTLCVYLFISSTEYFEWKILSAYMTFIQLTLHKKEFQI